MLLQAVSQYEYATAHESNAVDEGSKLGFFLGVIFFFLLCIVINGGILNKLVRESYLLHTQAFQITVNFHRRMTRALVRSPVAFFDANPSGSINTRFSKDTTVIDRTIYMNINTLTLVGS